MTFSFGPFELNGESRRLTRGADVVPLPDRHLDILLQLVSHAGHTLSKDALIAAAWKDVAVTDNSLEQAISALRRVLGVAPDGGRTYIETLARRGYRFAVPVTATPTRHSDAALAALLAPYRALVDGRAALETLDRDAVARALPTFEEMTRTVPDYAPAHLGLANALALSLEAVRAEHQRETAILERARHHASEACRLDPASGEAWATLALLCHQAREREPAIAAAQRAAALEADNWRHHLRLAYVSWGESRLRAAHRVLKLLPGFPFAHWLAATVHVARQAFDRAEEELHAGAAAQDHQAEETPFRGVGLHLLLGLVQLARDDATAAVAQFEQELALAGSPHIYRREACANAWCALAAVHLRAGRDTEALSAFESAVGVVAGHPGALAGIAALRMRASDRSTHASFQARLDELARNGATIEAALAAASYETLAGNAARAAQLVHEALDSSAAGSAAWSVPVDPILHVQAHAAEWQAVLALLRSRAV